MKIPFIGSAYSAASTNLGSQRCLNWFPEVAPEGKEPIALMPRPGMTSWCDTGAPGVVRGGLVIDDVSYVVVGAEFYTIDPDGTATLRGTLLTTTERVGIAATATQVMIVDGVYGYLYTIATAAYAQITDVDFVGADWVTALDGLFVVNDPGTSQMRCSDTYDGSAWDALDFATAESSSDAIVRVEAFHDELVVFGANTTEFWYNDAGSNFPFALIRGSTIQRGALAGATVAQVDNGLFWLGDDGVVYRMNGRQPQRVSTHAIEFALRGYPILTDAYAFTYEWQGHKFYCLTFPRGEATWVFDVATQMWSEAGTFGLGYWDVSTAWRVGTDIVVGSASTGEFFTLGDVYTDDGTPIERVRVAQCVADDYRWIRHDRLRLDFETGVGNATVTDPQVMLSWSDDGGHTFGNEIYCDMGAEGRHDKQVVFHRLGRSRQRFYKVRITDAVKCVLIGASLDASAA